MYKHTRACNTDEILIRLGDPLSVISGHGNKVKTYASFGG